MTVEEAIKNFINESEQYELYENYSGKCMFGRTCLGVIVQRNDSFIDFIIKLTKYLDDNGIEDVDFSLEGVSYDALGLDTIVYFPNIGGDCV